MKPTNPIVAQRNHMLRLYGHDVEQLRNAHMITGISCFIFLVTGIFFAGDAYWQILDEEAAHVFGMAHFSIACLLILTMLLVYTGQEILARWIYTGSVLSMVCGSVALTGGFPNSVAVPALICIPVFGFCIHGRTTGFIFASLVPVLCIAQWIAHSYGFWNLPDYTSQNYPAFNHFMVFSVTLSTITWDVFS